MLILILVVAFLILWFIIGKLYINLLKNTPYYKGKSPFFNGLTFNRLNKRHTVPKINFFTLVKYFIFKRILFLNMKNGKTLNSQSLL